MGGVGFLMPSMGLERIIFHSSALFKIFFKTRYMYPIVPKSSEDTSTTTLSFSLPFCLGFFKRDSGFSNSFRKPRMCPSFI